MSPAATQAVALVGAAAVVLLLGLVAGLVTGPAILVGALLVGAAAIVALAYVGRRHRAEARRRQGAR